MKILIIDSSTGVTGAFKSIYSSTRILHNADKLIFYFMLASRDLEDHIKGSSSIKVYRYNFIGLAKNIFSIAFFLPNLIFNSFKVVRIIRKEKIDILHLNDLYNLIGVVVKMVRPATKLVYHIRLLPDSYLGIIYPVFRKLIFKYADRIVVVSNAILSSLEGFPKDKVALIPDSIEIPKIHINVKDQVLTLIYLSNYTRGKGHERAIELMTKIVNVYPEIGLIMAGGLLNSSRNRKFKSELMDLVEHLHLSENVQIEDFQNDTIAYLSRGDIFLNFSKSESFSMTCLEAMSLGLPVVSTDSGGPRDIIIEDKTGYIVQDDIETIFQVVKKLIENPELRSTMSGIGRKRAKDMFSAETAAESLQKCYTELLY